jgi:hypothetical protein
MWRYNIYIAWWTNNTENGNEEVMFRASNDGGETFGERINLSNTTDADSGRVEIAAEIAAAVFRTHTEGPGVLASRHKFPRTSLSAEGTTEVKLILDKKNNKEGLEEEEEEEEYDELDWEEEKPKRIQLQQ